MRNKTIRRLLIIAVVLELVSLVSNFFYHGLPVIIGNKTWLLFALVNSIGAILNIIVFFKLLNSRYNYLFAILLLFIPIYVYSTFTYLFLFYGGIYFYMAFASLALMMILTSTCLFITRKPDKDVCILIDTDLHVVLVFSIVFVIISLVGTLIYTRLYYNNPIFDLLAYLPALLFGILLGLFVILIIHATIEYIKLKRVLKKMSEEEKEN